jgi:hypothetical protein
VRYRCEYLPHISSSFVDLDTEHILKSDTGWTQCSPHCTRCGSCCETGVAPAGFPWWWKSPEISWSWPRCHSAEAESSGAPDGLFPLPVRAWGMDAGPVARSKTAMWEFPTADSIWGVLAIIRFRIFCLSICCLENVKTEI